MRRVLDIVLTINLIFIIGLLCYFWWSGKMTVVINPYYTGNETKIDNELSDVFEATLKDEVNRQIGVPIEGYTPNMFTKIFPGLVATDFEDVEASVGKYVVIEGQLIHVTPPGALLHSASGAISRAGFATLLENIAKRTQINLNHTGTITEIMAAISG